MKQSEKTVKNKDGRMQLYLRGKEMAQRLIRVINRVLSGETETTACMEEDVNIHWLRRFVRGDISINRSRRTSGNAVRIVHDDWICWQDRFLMELTGEEYYAPPDFDQVYEGCTAKACSEQEREILRLRFQEGLTLRNTGERIGKSCEYVRQAESKALRKLRHPLYRLPLMYGQDYMEAIKQVESIQAEYDKARLARIQKLIKARKDSILKCQKEREQILKQIGVLATEAAEQAKVMSLEQILEGISVSDLCLSVRAENALKKHVVRDKKGCRAVQEPIRTVGQLSKLSHEELCSIVNLGTGSVCEIEEALFRQYGIRLGRNNQKQQGNEQQPDKE